jgi:hypothetical protein
MDVIEYKNVMISDLLRWSEFYPDENLICDGDNTWLSIYKP